MSLIEFASAWLLGVFTISITNDNEAISQCRIDLLDLENELKILRNKESNTQGHDLKQIEKITDILQLFTVHHAGVVIRHSELQVLIDKSLVRVKQRENNFDGPQNIPSYVGIDLGEIWGDNLGGPYEATKITETRLFLHAGFFKRIYLKMQDFIKKNVVLKSGFYSFIGMLSLVLCSRLLSILLNNSHFFSESYISWIKQLSIIPLAIVLYIEWDIQPAKKSNKNLLKALLLISLLIVMVAFCLNP